MKSKTLISEMIDCKYASFCFKFPSDLFFSMFKNEFICSNKTSESIAIIEIVYWSWGFPSSSSARLCTAAKLLFPRWNYFFLTASWSVIVLLCLSSLRSNKMGDTCCGCKQQENEKKTTDVIHMVVIHSPAARHLSCPGSRRGVVVQTRLTSTESHSG